MTIQRIVDTIIYETHKFGWFLGYTKLKPVHSQWIRYLWDLKSGSRGFMAYRGSYKSTACIIVGIVRRLLLFPNRTIFLCRKTFWDAMSYYKAIANIFAQEEVKTLQSALWGKSVLKMQENEMGLVFNIGNRTRERPHLRAISSGSSVTGSHADDIVFDDIITLADRLSQKERQRTKIFVSEVAANVLNPGGRLIFLGTKWHKDDAWVEIEKYAEVRRHRLSDGLINMTRQEISDKKQRIAPLLWNANYELDADVVETLIFKEPQFGTFPLDAWRKYKVIMHIDASYGGADSTAVTIRAGQNIIGFLFKMIQDKMGFVCALWNKYKVSQGFCEENADRGYIAKEFNRLNLKFSSYFESQNKANKIMTYLYKEWRHLIWDYETSEEYMEQIINWEIDAQHDDAPDSAATICRIYGAGSNNVSDEPLKGMRINVGVD